MEKASSKCKKNWKMKKNKLIWFKLVPSFYILFSLLSLKNLYQNRRKTRPNVKKFYSA